MPIVALKKFTYGGKEGPAAAAQAAKDLRKAKDFVDRRFAVSALGTLGAEGEAYADALAAALQDDDGGVRYWAAWALGNVKCAAYAPNLAASLSDKDPGVRLWLAVALGNLGAAATSEVLAVEGLLKDPDPQVRIAATRALVQIQPEAAPRVAAAVATGISEKDPLFRACAAEALGMVGMAAQPYISHLVGALGDPVASVRFAAVQTINGLGFETAQLAAPGLAAIARDDASADVRRAAAEALHQLRPDVALHSDCSALRRWAVQAIAQQHTCAPEHAAQLAKLLRDDDDVTRYWAAVALRLLGPAAAAHVEELQAALGDSDGTVRVAAMSAVVSCFPQAVPEALESLVAGVPAQTAALRKATAEALGLAGPAAQPHALVLQELLSDDDAEVRVAGVRALVCIGRTSVRDAGPTLGKLAMSDQDIDVRRAATTALREFRLGIKFGLPPE